MAKLILRCNYLKHAPPEHLHNLMQYIGTREGVEKVADSNALLPSTVKQKDIIKSILSEISEADNMHEYFDYIQNPTRANASEFITQALEYNIDFIAKKKNYMDYLANRPRVEKIGTHGLFSDEGKPVVLSQVTDEVANHKGVIWTNVISLRREDAERLGYDSGSQWQELLRSRVQAFAENYKIDSMNLKWYAAFHNESHHPHAHLVIYSRNPSEGYLTKNGIETMRSILAHDVFRQDFMHIYEKKNEQKKELKEEAQTILQELINQMKNGICHNEKITEHMSLLARRLQNTGGKKVYGYLKSDVKTIVNEIVDTMAKEEAVAKCYESWKECQNEVYRIYRTTMPESSPLSEQKEFKSIKNMVIAEAVKLGSGHFYLDDAGSEKREEYMEHTMAEISEEDEQTNSEDDQIESEDTAEVWKENIFKENPAVEGLRKNGQDWEHLEDAFDGYGLLLAGIAIKYIAKCGKELGKDIEVDQIVDHLCRRYYPHKDKGNLKTRLKNFQKVFDELIEVNKTKDLELPENKELFVKKCMGLSMECVKTHIFLHLELKVQKQERRMSIACNQ